MQQDIGTSRPVRASRGAAALEYGLLVAAVTAVIVVVTIVLLRG